MEFTRYDSLTEHLQERGLVADKILRRIDEAFDGHTVDGYCDGVYKMADGAMACDKSLKVWVAVDPTRVDELKQLASQFAGVLKQESLYFEVTEAEVEFVRPPVENGEVS